jgi:hypothetical protein
MAISDSWVKNQILFLKHSTIRSQDIELKPDASSRGLYWKYVKVKIEDLEVAKSNPRWDSFANITPGFRRQDNNFYWQPFPEFALDYRIYIDGDANPFPKYDVAAKAYSAVDPIIIRPLDRTAASTINRNRLAIDLGKVSIGKNQKIRAVAPGTIYELNGLIYRATDLYLTDSVYTGLVASQRNVFLGQVQIWQKVAEIADGVYEPIPYGNYWFNPYTPAFFLLRSDFKSTSLYKQDTTAEELRLGRIAASMEAGKSPSQAEAETDGIDTKAAATLENIQNGKIEVSTAATAGTTRNGNGTVPDNGTSTGATGAIIRTAVKVRGGFGFVNPGQVTGTEPQMVQYYKSAGSQITEPDRHLFIPKPNQINYQNLGSEWTEIDRAGRIPLVDWKNFRLMKVSFQFIVIPDETYRLGAFGSTADDGVTLSIDDKLEKLRNMAARPYPVILYGFDDLLTNTSEFVSSGGSGVQFVINDLTISSLMRTSNGAINRATCDITLQEVPIELINLISLPKLVPGQIIPPNKIDNPIITGDRAKFTDKTKNYTGKGT